MPVHRTQTLRHHAARVALHVIYDVYVSHTMSFVQLQMTESGASLIYPKSTEAGWVRANRANQLRDVSAIGKLVLGNY